MDKRDNSISPTTKYIICFVVVGILAVYFAQTTWVNKGKNISHSISRYAPELCEFRATVKHKMEYEVDIEAGDCVLELYNENGELVFSSMVAESTHGTIYFSDYGAGKYTFKYYIADQYSYGKIEYAFYYKQNNLNRLMCYLLNLHFGQV